MSERKDRKTCIEECLRALKDAFRQDRTLNYSIKLSSRKGVVYFQEDNVSVLASKREDLLPKLFVSIESNLNDNENIEIVEVSYKYKGNSPVISRDWTITNDTDDAEEVRRQFEESKRENEQLSRRNEELTKENEEIKSIKRNTFISREEEDEQNKRNKEQIDLINDTFSILGNVFGVKGLGDLNTPEGQRIQFAMGMLQKQMNVKEREEKIQARMDGLQNKLDDCESTLKNERLRFSQELERERRTKEESIRELKRENDRLKSESEKNLKKIDNLYRKMRRTEELQKDKDRRLREKMKPILEEYDKLKSKLGYSTEMVGGMLGTVLAAFAKNSKYGGLLGFVDDDPNEQAAQQAKAQAEQTQSQTVQEFYETMEEPIVAETYEEDEAVEVVNDDYENEEREEEQTEDLL